jgi:hypothetical protein
MQTHTPTVPFGRRSVPLGLIATQIETNAFAATSRTTRELVHKRQVSKDLSEARRFFTRQRPGSHNTACPPNVSPRDAEQAAKKVFATPYLFAPCGAYSCGRPNGQEEDDRKAAQPLADRRR